MIFIANFFFTIKQITITLSSFNTTPPSYINRKVIIFSSYIFLNLQELKVFTLKICFIKGLYIEFIQVFVFFFYNFNKCWPPGFNHFGYHQNQNQILCKNVILLSYQWWYLIRCFAYIKNISSAAGPALIIVLCKFVLKE